jgi:hypothetical protein
VTLQGYIGIEVLNTHMRECEGHESAFHLFDEVLLRGKRIFAFGNDDAHNTYDEEIIGQAWNMIESDGYGYEDLRDAIQSGRLYVSTGGRITTAVMRGGRFNVECPVDSRIVFVVNGERVLSTTGKGARYDLRRGAMYVRVEIESSEGRAYTQAAFPE